MEVGVDDLVDGVGWISDESDFYGDERTRHVWNSKAGLGCHETASPMPAVVAARSPTKAYARTASPTPNPRNMPTIVPPAPIQDDMNPLKRLFEERRLKHDAASKRPLPTNTVQQATTGLETTTKSAQMYFPFDGDEAHRQSRETIADFVKRMKPSTCNECEVGPWIWIRNPYLLPRSERGFDKDVLVDGGLSLLNAHRVLRDSLEQQMQGKAKSTITKKLNPARDKLEKDLFDLAVQNRCLSGKWMLFVNLNDIDGVWRTVADAVSADKLGTMAKVATGGLKSDNLRLICVYTKDFSDKADVKRVLDVLVELELVSKETSGRGIYYKNDAYTYWSITSDNEYKLKASLYSSKEMLGTYKTAVSKSGFHF